MHITKHAIARSRQRALPIEAIELLQVLGEEFAAKGHAKIVALTSRLSKQEFLQELKLLGIKVKKKWCDAYLVIDSSNSTIITAGYRYKRIVG